MYQIVYNFPQGQDMPTEWARIKNDKVYGSEAKKVKELLTNAGWPTKRPAHWALHGSIIWATLPILEDKETPKSGWVQGKDFLWEKDILDEAAHAAKLTNPQV